uniref:Uncharacterized protein n=1 Tax=Clytia hemisphaerica TaxID=252671 RepID=A0A7M5X5K8_9CNID
RLGIVKSKESDYDLNQVSLTAAERCIGIHNGCNSYGFFETYKTLFTPSCNEHDACYFCGHAFNITRKRCDDIFHYDMQKLCDEYGGWGCYTNAYLYWTGTRLFGANYYTREPLYPICQNDCIRKLLFHSHDHEHPEVFDVK